MPLKSAVGLGDEPLICGVELLNTELTAGQIMKHLHSAVRTLRTWAGWVVLILSLAGTSARGAEAELDGSEWPMFRGAPSLRGSTRAKVPEKPKLAWTFKTGGPVKSSPAVVKDKVFVGSDDSTFYALDLKSGAKVWSFKASGSIESSPLVLNDRVIFGSSDAWVYALDARDGKLAWKYETGDKVLSGPNWHRAGERTSIIVGSYDYKLHSIDLSTGKSNWVYETGNYINGSPAIFEGQTVFGGCDAILHVIGLGNGAKIKEVEAGAYIAGSVALADGHAYFGHYENAFLDVNLNEGKVAWTYKDRAFPYFSSPAVAGDRVVFGGRDKRLHCVKRKTGEAVWTFATRGKVDSSPVIAGTRVVVGSDDGRLYVVNLEDGKEVWNYEIGQPVGSSPAVVRGRIVVGADDGSVYCFESN